MIYETNSIYRQGLHSLFNKHKYLILIEIEHTCDKDDAIPSEEREIIEIAAICVDTKNLKTLKEFNRYVIPKLRPTISQYCVNLTGITQTNINTENEFVHVFEDFKQWLPAGKNIFLLFGEHMI